MKTILILEDDDRNMEMLVKIIAELEMQTDIKSASNQKDALDLAMKHNIDLFLIDIMLDNSIPGDVSGMKFAESIRSVKRYKYVPIIFVTALEDPELHAYSDIHCYYYIEKPYDSVKVSEVILEALEVPREKEDTHNVFFRKEGVLFKKNIEDIVYIENSRTGQVIHCTNGDLQMPYRPNKILMDELNSDKFIRCSRYHIINSDHIEEIDIVNRYIRMKSVEEPIEIGITYKKKLMRDLMDYAL